MSGRPFLVILGFTVQNVDYSQLNQNAAMKSDFTDSCKIGIVQTVNSQSGPRISMSDVGMTLMEGSVKVNAVVTPPAVSSSTTASAMQTDLLRDESTFANNVAAQVATVPGLSGITSGTISIGNLTARTAASNAPGPTEPQPSTGVPVVSVVLVGLSVLLVSCALMVWWRWPVRRGLKAKAPEEDASCVEAGVPGDSTQATAQEADKTSGCCLNDFTFGTPLVISARLNSPERMANRAALKAALEARGFTAVVDGQALGDQPTEYLQKRYAIIALVTEDYEEKKQSSHCEHAELKYYLEHKHQFVRVFPIKLSGACPNVPPDDAGQAQCSVVFSHERAHPMDLEGKPFDPDLIAEHVAFEAMHFEI